MDASSHIISILSASTLLSSIIHAIINTQRRLQKSDENIENVIKKEIKVILYHIQTLRQHLNQASIEAEVHLNKSIFITSFNKTRYSYASI